MFTTYAVIATMTTRYCVWQRHYTTLSQHLITSDIPSRCREDFKHDNMCVVLSRILLHNTYKLRPLNVHVDSNWHGPALMNTLYTSYPIAIIGLLIMESKILCHEINLYELWNTFIDCYGKEKLAPKLNIKLDRNNFALL